MTPEKQHHHHHDHKEDRSQAPPHPDASQETIFEIGETFQAIALSAPKDRTVRKGAGRRSKSVTDTKSGHYVRSRIPSEPTTDIAFDATLRAAAPHQPRREKDGTNRIKIQTSDIREKVRERKIGNVIIFVVDASGSMGANRRMAAAKGAVMSLLIDAYQKRDKVALIAFRDRSAELLLPPTSSVELAKAKLEELPTGGRTPLSQGLSAGLRVIESEQKRQPACSPLMILITDGKGNVAMQDENPLEEAKKIAAEARTRNIRSIVVDSEQSFIRLGKPQELAEALGAQLFRIEDLSADNLVSTIRKVINIGSEAASGEV